ncbi:unnamed protein product, partial [Staurois parvus]
MLLPSPECLSWVPCTALTIAAVSIAHLPCATFQVSSQHCWCRCLSWVPVRPPIAAVSIATLC